MLDTMAKSKQRIKKEMRFLMQVRAEYFALGCCFPVHRATEFKLSNQKANQSIPATPISNKLPMGDVVGGAWRVAADDSNRTWLRARMSRKMHKIKGKSGFTAAAPTFP